MPSFLSLRVRASRSLWRSPPTASSSFAACVSTPFPTPFRNSTTPTLAASRRNPTPVTRKEAPRDQGGGGGEGVYLGRAGRGTLWPEPHRRRGGGGAREMRTRGPWDGGARGGIGGMARRGGGGGRRNAISGRTKSKRCSTDRSDLGSSLLGLPNTNSKFGLDRGIEEKARPNLRQLDLLQISLFELKLERSTCILFSGPAGKQGNDFLANLHSVLLTIRYNVFPSHKISTSH